jgi:hypothetical protein
LTIAVILVLGVVWAAVLIPPILRARAQQARNDSVGDFHHRLTVLGRTNGNHRVRPARLSPSRPAFPPVRGGVRQTQAQKRRQDVLLVLLGLCFGTLVLAVLGRMPALMVLQLLADALLIGYVSLLLRYKRHASEQRSKVRYLNTAYRAPLPYFAGNLSPDGTSASSGPRLVPLGRTASN